MGNKSKTWLRLPIVDMCERHVDCVNRTAPVVSESTPFKMIRTTNVRNGYIDTLNVRYVTEEIYKKWTRRLVPRRGDIILTREAPLGDVGKVRTDDLIFLGQRLYHFRPDPRKLDADFLLYALMADDLQGQIQGFGSGATVEHMRLSDIPNLQIYAPAIHEQKRIGRILAAYDDLIENNTRRIAILEEMARRIYEEWFVHFRFPGHEKVKMVDSELGKIPEGWEIVSFTDITDVLSGGTPKTTIEEYWNGDIPFFAPKDAPKTFYTTATEKNITSLGLSKCNSKLYPKDTVFITARGTVGKVVMPSVNMAMNQSCYALRGREGINQLYLFLTTRNSVEYLKKNTGGATFDTIVIDTFRLMKVVKPIEKLLAYFDKKISPLFDLILNLIHRNTNLCTTRDFLLPKLISGDIDVSRLPELEDTAV